MAIPFLRLSSDIENPAPPTFLLPGGPGSTYLDDLEKKDFGRWLAAFLKQGDVVLLEQRGSDTSDLPLSCPLRMEIDAATLITPKLYQETAVSAFRRCADRYRGEGVPLEAFTVLEMASDFQLLREELGYSTMNLMGGSFGSQLGFAIIRADQQSVHRAVFYGVEGPGDTIDQPALVDRHLDRVSAEIDENWQFTAIAGDFDTALGGLLERLSKDPVEGQVDGDRVVVGDFDLKLILWSQEGLKGYRDNIARAGQLVAATELGMENFLLGAKRQLVDAFSREEGLAFNLMTFLVDCSSLPVAERQFPQSADGQLFGPEIVDSELRAVCADLDMPVNPEEALKPVSADTPVVLIAGGLDGFTPPEYARHAAQSLPASHLIEVPLGDHDGWDSLASQPEYFENTLLFLAGSKNADALPSRIDLPGLKVELIPTWIMILASAGVLLLVFVIAMLIRKRRQRAGRSQQSAQPQP